MDSSLLPCVYQRPQMPGVPPPPCHSQLAMEPTHAASHLHNSPSTPHPCCYHLASACGLCLPRPFPHHSQHSQPPSPLCSCSSSLGPLMLEQPLGQPCSPGPHASLCSRWHGLFTAPHMPLGTDSSLSVGLYNTDSERATCRLGDKDDWFLLQNLPRWRKTRSSPRVSGHTQEQRTGASPMRALRRVWSVQGTAGGVSARKAKRRESLGPG